MSTIKYRENHYVPQWYQRKFLPETGQKKYYYLDLQPEKFTDANGTVRTKKALQHWGSDRCFKQTDLYTTRFSKYYSTDIEQFFFGQIDDAGKKAIEYFDRFQHPSADGDAYQDFLRFMSVQKLRTPKGLLYLADHTRPRNANDLLFNMQEFQNLHCALWTECVWSIAEVASDQVHFIISDHPVTVYNEDCFPGSKWCLGHRDPEISQLGTHTLFPLSPTKILLLTNLAWLRNPYSNGTRNRPNPQPFRQAMFNFTQIQTGRKLSECEVHRINHIIKKRAFRYIAAEKEEWLYPERHIPSDHWRLINSDYLLMPDPRSVTFSSEVVLGYKSGASEIFDEYGRRPSHRDFKDQDRHDREWQTFLGFQGEYARLFGPQRRGVSFELGRLGKTEDSAEFHQHHLDVERKYRPAHTKSWPK